MNVWALRDSPCKVLIAIRADLDRWKSAEQYITEVDKAAKIRKALATTNTKQLDVEETILEKSGLIHSLEGKAVSSARMFRVMDETLQRVI